MPESREASQTGQVHAVVQRYYEAKLARFGPSPLGVDWSCQPTQELRFVQLMKVAQGHSGFSLNDLGCGYGALLSFLRRRKPQDQLDYEGIDLAPSMIAAAKKIHGVVGHVSFRVGNKPGRSADFCVGSGIFNVKLQVPTATWELLIESTLHELHRHSRIGFAVNFIDIDATEGSFPPELYRATSQKWAHHCEDRHGLTVRVLRGYGLREFTLHAFKPVPQKPPETIRTLANP